MEAAADARERIEAQLQPMVAIRGEPPESLSQKMARLGVAQVSVAVFRGNALDWAAGYGARTNADTLFQAASMSKLVAATGIATFARQRGVSLDSDISAELGERAMTALNPDGLPITLRGLLSHTNGATVDGFPGYPQGVPLPSNLELVSGAGGSNTPAVRIDPERYGAFHYSGGGFQLAQLWAEQTSGADFAALMHRLVLEPVGMRRSTFAQPLDAAFLAGGNIGPAYTWDGEPLAGGWHTYPEQAAAGLWTTPSDYGRFLMALLAAARGESDAGLDPKVVAEVIRAVADNYGLGVGVETKDGLTVLRHAGGNEGYRCYFEAYLERGDAIVTMSGSPQAFGLNADITRTAKRIYGWPVSASRVLERFPLASDQLRLLAGRYPLPESERFVEISVAGADLRARSPNGTRSTLVPIAADRFIDPDDAQEIVFAVDPQGRMTLTAGDRVLVRPAD